MYTNLPTAFALSLCLHEFTHEVSQNEKKSTISAALEPSKMRLKLILYKERSHEKDKDGSYVNDGFQSQYCYSIYDGMKRLETTVGLKTQSSFIMNACYCC